MKISNVIQMHGLNKEIGCNSIKSVSQSVQAAAQVAAIRESISPFTLQPSMAARKGLIGIITNSFESPYFGRIVQHASNYLSERGYHSIVQSGSRTRASELDVWLSLEACDCDGLIIHSDSFSDRDLMSLLDAFPNSVVLNRALPRHRHRCIYLDNRHGGSLAGAYLTKMGHENIAMVTGLSTFVEAKERTAGFLDALDGQKPHLVIEGNWTPESGAAAIRTIVKSNKIISAVFFHNDRMALGALEECKALGIRVPEDISIIGYDDIPFCDHTQPGLTSIHQSLDLIGEAAARLIHDMLDANQNVDRATFNSTVFTPSLAERNSVANLTEPCTKVQLIASELDCLEWSAVGKTHSETSHILRMSESTVDSHLHNAITKLNAKNEIHAVTISLQSGLISGRN